MATSFVELANSALTKIGEQAILSFDDDSNAARVMKLRFEPVKKIVLRMHPWNCAIKRANLAPVVGAPVFEYSYAFNIPSDCLRILHVHLDELYRIEQRQILANTNVLYIKYIMNVTEATQIDELLGEAIAAYLAWDTAFKITNKDDYRDRLWRDYELLLRKAKSVDAQEERDYEVQADEFLNSRYAPPQY